MSAGSLATYAAFCEWADTSFLIFSSNVFDPLIYYSHLVPILLSLPLAGLILYHAPRERLNQIFFFLVLLFSGWSFFDLILWAHADPAIIMFFWSLLILIEPLIYFCAYYFAYRAFYLSAPPVWLSGILCAGMVPILLFLPTTLAIESFNLTNCYREVTEGPLVFYGYLYQLAVLGIIMLLSMVTLIKADRSKRSRLTLFALAVIGFLLIFSSGNIIGSFLEDWTLGQYGIFGMPIMIAFLAVLIARYHMFNTEIITAELLIGALGVLSLGILFVQNISIVHIISLLSFVLILSLGAILIRSVRREIKQREEIEKLAKRLKSANDRLKILDQMKSEFVSIASHQLRSPLTSIRGYASMLLEGSFGKLPQKADEAVRRIADSSKYMALSVEDYLNVSRIQTGNMKYVYSEFNLRDVAETIVNESRPQGMKKGLLITFKASVMGESMVKADIGKTRQIIQNLVDNAIKYTQKGSIEIRVRDRKKPKRIFIDVSDSGIGISKETLETLFGKFERARNANEVNVTGTGLGLYVAKKMAEDMGGTVTAVSDGEGKGSTFTFELPYVR